jgi:ArsR family transcriptional regulator
MLMLYELHKGQRRVTELAVALNLPQPTVSRHLKILRERGLVKAHREGTGVIYMLSAPEIITAIDYMRSVLRLILDKESARTKINSVEDSS